MVYIFKDPNLLEMHTEVFMGKMMFCLFCLFKRLQKKKIKNKKQDVGLGVQMKEDWQPDKIVETR